jgi:hypothetical protein
MSEFLQNRRNNIAIGKGRGKSSTMADTLIRAYESAKILRSDKQTVERIARQTGLAEIDSVGAALDGWDKLPSKTRNQIVARRFRRPRKKGGRPRTVSSSVSCPQN